MNLNRLTRAILPVSMAKAFSKERSLQIIKFKKDKPIRICYLIYEKDNNNFKDTYHSILENKK